MEPPEIVAIIGGQRFDTATAVLLADDLPEDVGHGQRPGTTFLYRTPLRGRYFVLSPSQEANGRGAVRPVTRAEAMELWDALPRHLGTREDAFPEADADGWRLFHPAVSAPGPLGEPTASASRLPGSEEADAPEDDALEKLEEPPAQPGASRARAGLPDEGASAGGEPPGDLDLSPEQGDHQEAAPIAALTATAEPSTENAVADVPAPARTDRAVVSDVPCDPPAAYQPGAGEVVINGLRAGPVLQVEEIPPQPLPEDGPLAAPPEDEAEPAPAPDLLASPPSSHGASSPEVERLDATASGRTLRITEAGEWELDGVVRHDHGSITLKDNVLYWVTTGASGRLRRRPVVTQELWSIADVVRVEVLTARRGKLDLSIRLSQAAGNQTLHAENCRPPEALDRLVAGIRDQNPRVVVNWTR